MSQSENEIETIETPTPTTIKVALENGSKVGIYACKTNIRMDNIITTPTITLYRNNIYLLPIENKELFAVNFKGIITNPLNAHEFDVKSVYDGVAVVQPLVDCVIVSNGDIIGAMVE